MAAEAIQLTALQTRRIIDCKGKEFSDACKTSFKIKTGFTLIPIMPDGNCFYESLILFAKIYNVPEAVLPRNVMQLRQIAYNFMINHPDIYIHDNGANIQNIIKNTEWANPIFDYVTMVATDIFQINIVIYRAGRDNKKAYVNELSPIGSTHTYTARILHSGGNHYDLVIPNEHPKEMIDLLSDLSENHTRLIGLKQQYQEIQDKKKIRNNSGLTKRERYSILKNISREDDIKDQLDQEESIEQSILESITKINRNSSVLSPKNALNNVIAGINQMNFLTKANKDALKKNAKNEQTRKNAEKKTRNNQTRRNAEKKARNKQDRNNANLARKMQEENNAALAASMSKLSVKGNPKLGANALPKMSPAELKSQQVALEQMRILKNIQSKK